MNRHKAVSLEHLQRIPNRPHRDARDLGKGGLTDAAAHGNARIEQRFEDALTIGDFDGLLDSLLDGNVTMGDKMAAEYMRDTLEGAGLTSETLAGLSSSTNPQDKLIATTAATSATAMGVAQLSYEEAAQSLARIDGLVAEIANQEGLKESIDLNTRMAAETNYMLGQMWRLNAAAGLAAGQTGVNWAAEQAKEKSFFDYSGAE